MEALDQNRFDSQAAPLQHVPHKDLAEQKVSVSQPELMTKIKNN